MKKSTDKTDSFPAVLRGEPQAPELKCTVVLETKLRPGRTGNAISTCLRIDSAGVTPPDGDYRLNVRGRIFKVQRRDGEWPILNL